MNVPEPAMRQGLVQSGMPDWLVEQLIGVFDFIRKGELARRTDSVLALTGRPARRFANWALEHAGCFGID